MFSLQDIANKLGGFVHGDAGSLIDGLASLEDAGEKQISFFISERYREALKSTRASAVLLAEPYAADCPVDCIVVENPQLSYIDLAKLFKPKYEIKPGVHPTAVVSDTAIIHNTAVIGPYCVVGERVQIGARTELKSHCVIESDCVIGEDALLYSHVTFYNNVKCADKVIVHSASVIGSDGFGNVQHQGRWNKIPHLGGVTIEDDVEIGASTTIDCGRVKDTILRRGVKLDNQIHIAHNVDIGEDTAMAACSAIAGSTKVGKRCMFSGKVGVADNLTIADEVIFLASSIVCSSIEKSGIYSNSITRILPHTQWNRIVSVILKLPEWKKKLKKTGGKFNG
jgi:UDP-3-O-[3-hydroxymyristoyl] glucosamine N-acyltransferase